MILIKRESFSALYLTTDQFIYTSIRLSPPLSLSLPPSLPASLPPTSLPPSYPSIPSFYSAVVCLFIYFPYAKFIYLLIYYFRPFYCLLDFLASLPPKDGVSIHHHRFVTHWQHG